MNPETCLWGLSTDTIPSPCNLGDIELSGTTEATVADWAAQPWKGFAERPMAASFAPGTISGLRRAYAVFCAADVQAVAA